jgi:hypothetical protein
MTTGTYALKESLMAVKSNTQAFHLSVVGDKTGETLKGDFVTTRILSHRQQLLSDRLVREYLGGDPKLASAEAYQRASILADINSALVTFPKFWREAGMGLDLIDDNVVAEVWNAVQKAQVDAVAEIQGKADTDATRLKAKVEETEEVRAAKAKEEAEE